MCTAALIVAAGQSTRLADPRGPKPYLPLAGAPVLRRAVQAFRTHPGIGRVQVVIGQGHREAYEAAVGDLGLPEPLAGGASRQDSVRRGLEALAAEPPDLVLIHDAARPLVGAAVIDGVLCALAEHAGALPALPVADSLSRGSGGLAGEPVDRSGLWRAQTPQGFRFPEILAAHREAGPGHTDDVSVARAAGLQVALTPGEERNFKLTGPNDLARAVRELAAACADIRTGSGFDVHRLGPGDGVMLCGVLVPHDGALIGHSDADVALHALTDALLGTLADGDIGSHFPPADPQWRGAASELFVRHAARRVADRGGAIAHVDLTIVCERPRIGPHRAAMRERVAGMLDLDPGRVSVKSTTTERLGFTGRGEGIAAQAVATIRLPL